jgi:hypothetical protein
LARRVKSGEMAVEENKEEAMFGAALITRIKPNITFSSFGKSRNIAVDVRGFKYSC